MYEPPRRLVYRTRSAAEVLGYTVGSLHQLRKARRIEAWPYGAARRINGTPAPVFYVYPHRAIRANLERRGATHYVHPEPVWKPLYTPAETKVLLDLSGELYRRFVEDRDLEEVVSGSAGLRVTRLSIDALLERWEAGELSDLEAVKGELPEHRWATELKPPTEGNRRCGWCGKWRRRSDTVVVGGRIDYPGRPRLHTRRVCRRCVEARIADVRRAVAGGRAAWVDNAWVEWSVAAKVLGVSYEGLQPSLQAAVKAGTAKMSDFQAGGVLWTDKLEERYGEGPAPEPEPGDDEWEWEPPDIEAALEEYEAG